jgi:uroporphyrinogen decarboxylase
MNPKLHDRKPNIENMYKVLRCEAPERPTLFELFMNLPLYERLAGRELPKTGDAGDADLEYLKLVIDAYAAAGFDYATTHGSGFGFKTGRDQRHKSTLSLNEGAVLRDEASFEAYEWAEPENYDYSKLEKIRGYLPDGMKLMAMGPGGVLENVIALTGYDSLCFMLYEEPGLLKAIFDNVGRRLLKYYEIVLAYDSVGLIMSNDDWGFNTQTFLSPEQMREYVFPWHKRIVDAAHAGNRPALLHSCGNFNTVMEDTIETLGFDGKHSYEDNILPVEESYERWNGRIAILGGIDVNFMINRPEEEIRARCAAMLKRAESRGGYALGTGNSVPEYIPQDHYIALLEAALNY